MLKILSKLEEIGFEENAPRRKILYSISKHLIKGFCCMFFRELFLPFL